ncbi:MAG: GNAT family N-acetyltransferase [Actinomycetota bacterium]|nr:GNAT family N-acetyltransferase [Actinomycetota bacterium]
MISRADDSDVIRWGREQARAGPWQGDPHVAYLVPLPSGSAPSLGFVRWAMAELSARGFSRVVTNALAPMDQVAFLGAGFEVQERLHLLAHDLRRLPGPRQAPPEVGHRRVRPADQRAVLDLDARAFPAFWRLDQRGLEDAVRATPRTRFRVLTSGEAVIAYALTGRARRRGFLQRLAVDPAHWRRGLGGVLVLDALRWLRRWGAERAAVNTPTGNQAAVALYESLGFRCEPLGLSVLSAGLDSGLRTSPWAERRERSDR